MNVDDKDRTTAGTAGGSIGQDEIRGVEHVDSRTAQALREADLIRNGQYTFLHHFDDHIPCARTFYVRHAPIEATPIVEVQHIGNSVVTHQKAFQQLKSVHTHARLRISYPAAVQPDPDRPATTAAALANLQQAPQANRHIN
ncbi:MAG: hypothetical protein R6X16_02800 [Anaerolineae bacterium]